MTIELVLSMMFGLALVALSRKSVRRRVRFKNCVELVRKAMRQGRERVVTSAR